MKPNLSQKQILFWLKYLETELWEFCSHQVGRKGHRNHARGWSGGRVMNKIRSSRWTFCRLFSPDSQIFEFSNELGLFMTSIIFSF